MFTQCIFVNYYLTAQTDSEMMSLTSYDKAGFNSLLDECMHLKSKFGISASDVLFIYLMKMRTARSNVELGHFFKMSHTSISNRLITAREPLMKDIVLRYLLVNRTREELVACKSKLSSAFFDGNDHSRAHIALDGTYLFIEKSKDHTFQKQTYNSHKKRNYIKVMMGTATNSSILFAHGPFKATENDASIIKKLLQENNSSFWNFSPGDIEIVDRGFRDSVAELMNKGFVVKMPACSTKSQLSTLEANLSRLVTRTRYDVERCNGVMKCTWKVFEIRAETYWVPHIMNDFQICAGLINRKQKLLVEPDNIVDIAAQMMSRVQMRNVLRDVALSKDIEEQIKKRNYTALDNSIFPEMTMENLWSISFGNYQILKALLYLRAHLDSHDNQLDVFVFDDIFVSSKFEYLNDGRHTVLIMSELKSRFSSARTYRTLILFNPDESGSNTVLQRYCVCFVGSRTVGCCSHVMAILFFLGYAQYNGGVQMFCRHLKNVFIRDVNEAEN